MLFLLLFLLTGAERVAPCRSQEEGSLMLSCVCWWCTVLFLHHQSHWMELFNFHDVVSLMDQHETNQNLL
jgi:hypothetical protein